jgi:hypothetical protein
MSGKAAQGRGVNGSSPPLTLTLMPTLAAGSANPTRLVVALQQRVQEPWPVDTLTMVPKSAVSTL